jgi:hypothetical protein
MMFTNDEQTRVRGFRPAATLNEKMRLSFPDWWQWPTSSSAYEGQLDTTPEMQAHGKEHPAAFLASYLSSTDTGNQPEHLWQLRRRSKLHPTHVQRKWGRTTQTACLGKDTLPFERTGFLHTYQRRQDCSNISSVQTPKWSRGWDGRDMVCHHEKANGECGTPFNVLSNELQLDEIDRQRTPNDLWEGPLCAQCGARYADRPEEFIFNGTHGKLPPNAIVVTRRQPDSG